MDSGVGPEGHNKEVVGVFNDTDKSFLSMFMATVQLPGAKAYYTKMEIHTSTVNKDISLSRESQKNIWSYHVKIE